MFRPLHWNVEFGLAILPVVRFTFEERSTLETHGPLGTLWMGIGLGCFYIALIWLNTLLGFFLTPLFIIPGTWLMDQMGVKRNTSSSQP